jgi:Na+/melibiose symporter-like transporter
MDRSWPSCPLPVRLGEPVNTAAGPQDARPPAAGRRVVSSGVGITLIAVGAILRFALAAGSPHGLNVHVVGVVLILAGVLELLLSLVRVGQRRPRSLVRQGRGGYYRLPGPNARLQTTKQAAAADVAEVLRDERFYAPDAPGREEDDL